MFTIPHMPRLALARSILALWWLQTGDAGAEPLGKSTVCKHYVGESRRGFGGLKIDSVRIANLELSLAQPDMFRPTKLLIKATYITLCSAQQATRLHQVLPLLRANDGRWLRGIVLARQKEEQGWQPSA